MLEKHLPRSRGAAVNWFLHFLPPAYGWQQLPVVTKSRVPPNLPMAL